MGTRLSQYAKNYEGNYAKTGSTGGSHEKAEKGSRTMAKVVKPTAAEQRKIDARLKAKYPQMYDDNWPGRLKKKVKAELERQKTSKRTKQVSSGLKAAGLSDKEIAKLRGK